MLPVITPDMVAGCYTFFTVGQVWVWQKVEIISLPIRQHKVRPHSAASIQADPGVISPQVLVLHICFWVDGGQVGVVALGNRKKLIRFIIAKSQIIYFDYPAPLLKIHRLRSKTMQLKMWKSSEWSENIHQLTCSSIKPLNVQLCHIFQKSKN